MEENIRIQLIEMSRLMSYDRSKTLFEQTNNPEIDDKGNNINPNASYYGTTDKVTPYEQEMADRFHDGDVESYRKFMRQQEDLVLQGLEKDRMSSYQDRFANNRYNPIKNQIDRVGIDNWMRAQQRAEALRYKGNKKPTEPTRARGEGYYIDGNSNHHFPKGYWYISYNSPRYKEYYAETIKPILDLIDLNGKDQSSQAGMPPFILTKDPYKEDVWDIYRQDLEDWEERQEGPLEFLKDWTVHDWLETAELITGLIGMIPFPPTMLAANLLSMGFGATNAAVYFSEGKNYDASIALAFALMPGPAVASEVKSIKNTISTATKGGKVTEKELVKNISANNVDKVIKNGWRETLKITLRETLQTKGKHWTFKFLVWLSRTIKNYYVKFAGIPIAFDTLYYLYTLTLKGDEQLTAQEARDKSDFKIIIDILKNPTEIINLMIDIVGNDSTEEDIANSEKFTETAANSIKAIPPDERERNNMKLANERGWKIPPKKD